MHYYQPAYTLVTNKSNATKLTASLSLYQAALWHALDLEVMSDGEYNSKGVGSEALWTHDENLAANAIKHAIEILDFLDINTVYEYLTHKEMIRTWFSNSVRDNKREYVWLDQQWYVREWVAVKLKKPKHKMATVYQHDARAAVTSPDVHVAFDDGKKVRPLVHSGKMAGRTKLSTSEQQKFMRGLRGRMDDANTVNRYREHSLKMQNRFRTERTVHVNDTVQEILSHSRYVVYCQPIGYNDNEYMNRIGMPEVVALLRLVALMTRRKDEPVVFVSVDTRPFRVYFDVETEQPRAFVANQIAGLYMQLRRSVEE